MKRITLILAVYSLFLASLPTLSIVDDFPEMICCTHDHDEHHDETQHEEHQEEAGDECADVCNPFFSCQCFHSFVTSTVIHPFTLSHVEPNSWINYSFISPAISDVWHPPRA